MNESIGRALDELHDAVVTLEGLKHELLEADRAAGEFLAVLWELKARGGLDLELSERSAQTLQRQGLR